MAMRDGVAPTGCRVGNRQIFYSNSLVISNMLETSGFKQEGVRQPNARHVPLFFIYFSHYKY